MPFVAVLSLDDEGHPLRVKLTPVSGFTNKAIADGAKTNLTPGCSVLSDGLGCFAAVTEAGCQHQASVVGGRKPRDMPEFLWINTILGNLKTSLGGAYHAFDFAKYATRYLAAFAYRSTAASSLIRSRLDFSWLPLPLGLAQMLGCGQLKHLANQVLCGLRTSRSKSCGDSNITGNRELNGLNSAEWLNDTLEKLPICLNSRIDELLPLAPDVIEAFKRNRTESAKW